MSSASARTIDGDGRHHHRHRRNGNGHEYADYEVSPETCGWLKRNARRSGGAYWWQRYVGCREDWY
jgi:hypothetical protein